MSVDASVVKVLIANYEEQAKQLLAQAEKLKKALANAPAADSETEGGKKKRKKKDTGVKRALSGYQVFMKEQLHNYKVRHPEIPQKEILTILSQRWKGLSEDKRNKYLSEATRLKDEGITAAANGASSSSAAAPSAPRTIASPETTTKKRKHSESESEVPASQPAGSETDKKKKKSKKDKKKAASESDDESS